MQAKTSPEPARPSGIRARWATSALVAMVGNTRAASGHSTRTDTVDPATTTAAPDAAVPKKRRGAKMGNEFAAGKHSKGAGPPKVNQSAVGNAGGAAPKGNKSAVDNAGGAPKGNQSASLVLIAPRPRAP